MGLKADLLRFYFYVETKYYELCDWLREKKVPVYDYFITPVETRGLPSFPVAVICIMLFLGVVALLVSLATVPQAGSSIKGIYVKVLGNESTSLENAAIELLSANGTALYSGVTNSTGEFSLVNIGNAVRVKVTHSDYETFATAVKEKINVRLRLKTVFAPRQLEEPREQPRDVDDVDGFVEQQQFGSFELHLKEVGSGTALTGAVRVFDAATDNLISEVDSPAGAALIENLPLNQHVYFAGVVEGFSSNRSVELSVSRDTQTVDIEFVAVPVLNTTISIISALTRQPLQGATVKVFDEQNVFIGNGTTSNANNLTFSLSIDKRYYINAKKENFLTTASELFYPTSNVVVELLPAVPENVSILRVHLADEYGEPLPEAIASVYAVDGRVLGQSTTPSSDHSFHNLQRNSTVSVRASARDLTSRANVTLNDSVNDVTMQMEVRFAVVSLDAFDLLTREQLNETFANITRNGVQFALCSTPCNVTVKTRGVYIVKFSRLSYFNYTFRYGLESNPRLNAFEENSVTLLNASLMPLASVRDSRVVLNGVFDAVTYERVIEGGSLSQGRVYFASLSGYFVGARFASVVFNASASSDKVSILNFTPYPLRASLPLQVRTSTSRNPADCGSGLTGSKWKRAVITSTRDSLEPFSQDYVFFFVAKAPSRESEFYNTLDLNYRSFIKKGNGDVVRNPFDQNLTTNNVVFSGDSSECSAEAYTASFGLNSPNDALNDFGKMSVSFFQDRNVGVGARSPGPESCGSINGTGAGIEHYVSFDCNGFPVDSGLANPLQVKARILLNNNVKGGVTKLIAGSVFNVSNASFSVDNGQPSYLDSAPSSALFEHDIPAPLFGITGSSVIEMTFNLTARASASYAQVTVEFKEKYENGSLGPQRIDKTLWVSINPINASLPEDRVVSLEKCGFQSRVNYSYDDRLLYTGSGWLGCSEIPLYVDPLFPADAVPIYIENSTGDFDCRISEGDSMQSGVVQLSETSINQRSASPTGATNCFDIRDDLVEDVPGYKGYALRFNAVKCGGVTGNSVFRTNASFDLICTGRSAGNSPFDVKTIKVNVQKVPSAYLQPWSNFIFSALRGQREANPKLFAVIDNLQVRPPGAKRNFAFNLTKPYAQLITVQDQPASAFALAISPEVTNFEFSEPNDGMPSDFSLLEEGRLLSDVQPLRTGASDLLSSVYDFDLYGSDILGHVRFVNELRLKSAFRRSTQVDYYCQGGPPYRIGDVAKCRPTITDWVAIAPANVIQSQPCAVCLPGDNCDSTCDAITGKKPDGAPCFNWCGSPVCESSDVCRNGVKSVSVGTRAAVQWLNSSELKIVPVLPFHEDNGGAFVDHKICIFETPNGHGGESCYDGETQINEDFAAKSGTLDAPFKYFPDETSGKFSYTQVLRLRPSDNCEDTTMSVANLNREWGTCFVPEEDVFEKYPVQDKYSEFGPGGTLKISEPQGGCDYSFVHDRGYYRITYEYYKNNRGASRWKYYAEPLELSTDYIQNEESNSACRKKALLNGQRTKLCYYLFNTSANPPSGPGKCVRSLRDYVVSEDLNDFNYETSNLVDVPAGMSQELYGDAQYMRNRFVEYSAGGFYLHNSSVVEISAIGQLAIITGAKEIERCVEIIELGSPGSTIYAGYSLTGWIFDPYTMAEKVPFSSSYCFN